jgi:hypothetical protein
MLLRCEVFCPWNTNPLRSLANFPQLLTEDPENEITLTAFRLLTMDLLVLFHVMNEGTINVLG